jgi:acetylornithine deacetylase/succinyl-diaminopimelate desuccinylase
LVLEKEREIAQYIGQWFEKSGINVKLEDVTPNRPNVIATIEGSGDGYSLMYNCHTDTVPEYGWTAQPGPFETHTKEGKIYGRGSCDMKGAIAAVMIAMKAIHNSGAELGGDLMFAGVVGEEGDGSIGTKALVQKKTLADMAVVCEPTDMNISIGHRGSSNLLLSAYGKPAHSAYPEKGINAITMMANILQALQQQIYPKLKKRKHRLLGPSTLTPALIQGGMRTDVVPDYCEVKLNYRYPPGQEPTRIREELSSLLESLHVKNPELRAEIKIASDSLGMEIPEDHLLVKTLRQTMKAVKGESPRLVGSGFWTDASILTNQGNVPSVIFGPGKESIAHTTMEYVDADQLLQATQAYALASLEICRKKRTS